MAEPVPAQDHGSTQTFATAGSANAGPHVFTVMGHVRNQRAFELATASPSLVQVVETFAQGLTASASNNVRIIRNGRVINSFYRKESTERLMPGDLVIVDGRSVQGTIYRGSQSNADSSDRTTRVGLIGLLPYPVILQSDQSERRDPRQPITVSQIARQLGQSESAATQARLIIPRRFAQTDATTPLPDCSVILFDPSTIDVSRLPNLPSPYQPGLPTATGPRHDAVATMPRPHPGIPGMTHSPAQGPAGHGVTQPGVAVVPQVPPSAIGSVMQPPRRLPELSQNQTPRNDQPLQRNDEERVRDLLTAPSSVPVETPGAAAATVRQPPGRVRLDDSTSADSAADAQRTADRPQPVDTSRVPKTYSRGQKDQSPATKPFQSFNDGHIAADSGTTAGDSSGLSDNASQSSDAPVELPLTPTDPRDAASATPTSEPPVVAGELSARIASPDTAMPFPTPVATNASARPQPIGHQPLTGQRVAAGQSALMNRDGRSTRVLDAALKGSVDPKPVRPTNWPLISAAVIGGLAAVSVVLMMISVSRQKTEQPTPVVLGQRYWLDRIIQNELPIDDEPVLLPQGEQLFGKAMQVRRVDAAHHSVPKPHFLAAGGASGVRRPGSPSPAEPESGESDAPRTTTNPSSKTRTPQRDDRPGRSLPAVPLRPAAEHRSVETPTADAPAAEPHSADRPVVERRATATEQPLAVDSTGAPSIDRVQTLRREPLRGVRAGTVGSQDSRTVTSETQPVGGVSSSGISLDIARLPPSNNALTQKSPTTKLPTAARHQQQSAARTERTPVTTAKPARRNFRLDNGHQGIPQRTPISDEATLSPPAARTPLSKTEATEVSGSAEPPTTLTSETVNLAPTRGESSTLSPAVESRSLDHPAIPRPRFLQRRRVVTPGSQASVAQPDGQAASSEPAGPDSDISITPARSVSAGADLLDRVLSSVQREKRGDR